MNRGVLQSPQPAVQQMMVTGNPNYYCRSWNNNNNNIFLPQLPPSFPLSSSSSSASSSSSSSSSSSTWHGEYNFHQQDLTPPESWRQLLMGGIIGGDEEDKCGSHELGKKLENWDQQHHHHHHHHVLSQLAAAEDQHHHHLPNSDVIYKGLIKQEKLAINNSHRDVYSHGGGGRVLVHDHHRDIDDQLIQQQPSGANNWSQMMLLMQSSAAASTSPNLKSPCVMTNNMLNFSTNFPRHPPQPNHSSQYSQLCNSSSSTTTTGGTGGAVKKARVQASASHSTQATFKVRKEKLGDRITALHQLVSPFGKTDTASVLLEAIGYIRFLHSQVEALSLPYLGGGAAGNISHQQPAVQVERNCLFPDDPGQLLNDHCIIKRKGVPDHQLDSHFEEQKKDLRSRGLCLVPISCTMQVESNNIGADYWTPAAAFGGGFR